MTDEIYKKATQLQNDIQSIDRQLKEVQEERHWITTSTPMRKDQGASSVRFQNELVNWLKEIRDKYQKEFNEL